MVGLLLPSLYVSLLLAFRVTTEPKHQSSKAVESLVGSLLLAHTSPFSAAPTTLYFGTQDTPEIASLESNRY